MPTTGFIGQYSNNLVNMFLGKHKWMNKNVQMAYTDDLLLFLL